LWGEEDEYEVEEILRERVIRRRGGPKKKYLVKWLGYAKPTWEPASALEETVALENWWVGLYEPIYTLRYETTTGLHILQQQPRRNPAVR